MDEASAVLLRRCRPIVDRHHSQTQRALLDEIDAAAGKRLYDAWKQADKAGEFGS